LFNEVVDTVLPALSGVSQLLAGGDVLSVDHVQKVRDTYPKCQVINGYGPTENTTFSCCYRVPVEEDLSDGVPIGHPITNGICYVLNPGLEPVPIGVTGELYVSGAGLARGYLNRAGLTAERFVPDPHALEPGTRMYRTGDLARWRDDGALEFLGRIDQQVKIRGFRIELGEIEAALSAQPAVAQAAVIAREGGPEGKQLVAYVVTAPGEVAEVAALRRELSNRLPDYMVPTIFVSLNALPLTPNGKVNRAALPAPDAASSRLENTYVAPRSPVEEKLCDIWSDVLRVEKVGINDNFLDLGGHSLLAMRVVSRVNRALNVELPMRLLFERPTVSALALAITRLHLDQATPGEVAELLRELEADGENVDAANGEAKQK
jgi:acyl carrier protein